MEITKISYSEGQSIAVKRFENIKPIVTAEAKLDAVEDADKAMEMLRSYVKRQLKVSVDQIKEAIAKEA